MHRVVALGSRRKHLDALVHRLRDRRWSLRAAAALEQGRVDVLESKGAAGSAGSARGVR